MRFRHGSHDLAEAVGETEEAVAVSVAAVDSMAAVVFGDS